ncbi:MAG: hypothetical protein EU529_11520 [Promethearchaeota archaeon]|nr:MAG: hypothetical protein EU529_11520 [Candidatus Lokiarchaeota archaeon]
MAKGKKKKKKTEKSPKEATTKIEEMPEMELSLDSALSSALSSTKETQTDLQGLLHKVSEVSWYDPEPKEKEIIEPQLIYERKNESSEDYLEEDIPKSKGKETKAPAVQETVVAATVKETIYKKLEEFLEEYMEGNLERYNRWEESTGNILAILRKMRKFTKKNTEDLITSINNQFEKIQLNLDQFKIKRDEIEKISGVNIETLSGEFKKVLGLLELQVKEYQLKKFTDEYISLV